MGALSVTTRQTNIIWVGFIVAVSVIRELKEADVVDANNAKQAPGSRRLLMFDQLAMDAQFPGTILFSGRPADSGNLRGLFHGDMSMCRCSRYAFQHIAPSSVAICADFRGFRLIPRVEQRNCIGCHTANFEKL